MKRNLYRAIVLGAIFFAQLLVAAPKQLTRQDIRPTMDELFNYHVEYKELAPILVKRSFKLYIEYFDSDYLYLLADEAKPFLEQSQQQLGRVIEDYQGNSFVSYEALNGVIQKAIVRAQEWRQEIERELIVSPEEPKTTRGESYVSFAHTPDELKQRIRRQLVLFMHAEKPVDHAQRLSPAVREKIFALYEKQSRRLENHYLMRKEENSYRFDERSEHYFSLHILKALAKSLDAHTSFFSAEEAFEMRASLEKQFEGIGVILKESVDGVAITGIIKGSPAERCGKVQPGDLLVQVDGRSMHDLPYEEVLASLKTEGDQEIRLGLKRFPEEGEPLFVEVKLQRERILMQDERLSYSEEPFGDGYIGKLVLPSFYESGRESSCEIDMREAIKSLKKRGKLLGLVIDMRENSGGFLNQAVKVAGLFITSGVIVISKYAHGEAQYLRTVDGRAYFNGPILILASKASASAAEIVAQALQDYGAALVVGDERTYGKGTIQYQTVTDDDASAYFKVTVGKYYTVSGKSTQIEGVKADIVVPTIYSAYNIGERFLEYPLTNDHVPSSFVDPLSDIDERNKSWFQKNYLPNVQKRESYWRQMLPMLKGNSAYRLAHDKNFQLFLKAISQPRREFKLYSAKDNWGVDDLQMAETVQILKDMIVQSSIQQR